MKKIAFTKADFAFICPMQWEDMEEAANGKFCRKCQQEVINVTDCSLEEVTHMQKKAPHLCVAIKTLVTTGVALTMTACTQQMVAGGISAPPPQKPNKTQFIAGGIAPPPEGQMPDFSYIPPQQTIHNKDQQDKKKPSANKKHPTNEKQCDLPKK